MNILLDTNILLLASKNAVPKAAAEYLNETSNIFYFSPASIWEVIIKKAKYPEFDINPTILMNNLLLAGYEEIKITGRHSLLLETLPNFPKHKDPFDRIMIAQSIAEGFSFMTTDKYLINYPGSIIFINK